MKRFQRLALYVTLFAVALMMAAPALACPVSVGSFAVAQPAFVAAPQAVYQSSIGVQCGQQLALAQPQAVYAAPAVVAAPFVLPSYQTFAIAIQPSFAVLASPFVSFGASFRSHVGFNARLNEHRAVRLNARAQHAAIRAQR